jgi:hypothetical protein
VLDKALTVQIFPPFKGAQFDGTLRMHQMGDGQEQNPVRQIVRVFPASVRDRIG